MQREFILTDDENKKEKLREWIQEAQGRATVRLIKEDDIYRWLDVVERRLGITKKAMQGVFVHIDPNAQDFPRAYKYTPESTQFDAYYKNGTWRLIRIARGICEKKRIHIELSASAKEAILNKYKEIY